MRISVRWDGAAVSGRRHRWLVLGPAACLLVLGGCGVATSGTGGTGATPSTTGGANAVTVSTDKAVYAPGDTIVVTIANNLATSVWAADHQSNCTIVTVERLVGGTWERQNPCLRLSPTRLIEIQAGTVSVQRLSPPTQSGVTGWPTGSYRVVFTYLLTQTGPSATVPPVAFTVR